MAAAIALCFCAASFALAEESGAAESNATPPRLTKALDEGIAMLESYAHEQFITRFIIPEDKAKKLKSKTMEELINGFAKDKAGSLERIFRSVKNKTPELSGDGKKAAYSIEMEPGKKQKIEFRLIGGEWRLKN
jgi:hypothetical protein